MAKGTRLEKQGKLLVYSKCDEETQALFNISRKAEWDNYLKFNAVRVISAEEAQTFLDQGAEMVPMRWVETDNEKLTAFAGGLDLLLSNLQTSTANFVSIFADLPSLIALRCCFLYAFAIAFAFVIVSSYLKLYLPDFKNSINKSHGIRLVNASASIRSASIQKTVSKFLNSFSDVQKIQSSASQSS